MTVRGTPAPLLAIANLGAIQQINFQVPNEPIASECIVDMPALSVIVKVSTEPKAPSYGWIRSTFKA